MRLEEERDELTEEEIEDYEYDIEWNTERIDALEVYKSAFEEFESLKHRNVFNIFNERMRELYDVKHNVLDSLEGDADGMHSFGDDKVRKVYNLGGYSFHGDELSEAELNGIESIKELDEISSENKLAEEYDITEAEKVLGEYLGKGAVRFSVREDGEYVAPWGEGESFAEAFDRLSRKKNVLNVEVQRMERRRAMGGDIDEGDE